MSAYRIRVDPWSTEYESALQILPEEDADAAVELGVEGPEWQPLRPAPAALPAGVFFVDGVRRIEHRLLIESEGRTLFGLLGSFGVRGVHTQRCLAHPFRAPGGRRDDSSRSVAGSPERDAPQRSRAGG